MSIELQPLSMVYQPTEQRELGKQLYHLTRRQDVAAMLAKRHLLAPVAKYGQSAFKSYLGILERGRPAFVKEELGTFVIRGSRGDVIGIGTVEPQQTVRQLRTSINTRLTRLLTGKTVDTNGPEVIVWTKPTDEGWEALSEAYQLLADPDGKAAAFYTPYRDKIHPPLPWTVESLDSPPEAHEAIGQAGYIAYSSDWYDTGAIRDQRLPRSYLYERPST